MSNEDEMLAELLASALQPEALGGFDESDPIEDSHQKKFSKLMKCLQLKLTYRKSLIL
jgi:hypothetical protein